MSSLLVMLEKAVILTNMYPLSFLLLFVFLFFFVLYKSRLGSSSTRKLGSIPSPPKLPILGHLHRMGTHPHESLRALSRQYGELMLLHLGSRPTVIVTSAKLAREIFKTHDAVLSNRPYLVKYAKLFYNCRDLGFTAYGEYWRQMKSIFVLQLLSNKRVRSYRGIREEETAIMIENHVRNSTKEVNLSDMFATYTNNVICRVAFGRKYTGDQKLNVDFRDFLDEFVALLGIFSVGDFIPWMSWINRFNGLNTRMDNAFNKFDMLIEEIVKEHSNRLNHENRLNSDKPKDIIDILLEAQRENLLGFPIARDSIKALIVDIFAAGTHTSTSMLEWAMAELLRNPTIMEKLQKEVRGIRKRELITEEDLESMKYFKAVTKETLRLHPGGALLVPRESTENLKLNGHDIPAKTMVIINAWAIQRDPITWDEPEEFRPERFLNSTVNFKGHDFELIPFGGGRRICPAIAFTIANNELILANLVNKFNWSLPGGATSETLDMSEGTGNCTRMKNTLFATATPYTYSI